MHTVLPAAPLSTKRWCCWPKAINGEFVTLMLLLLSLACTPVAVASQHWPPHRCHLSTFHCMCAAVPLPAPQWENLLHLDTIKARSKPIQPPKKPEAAPFFLPTVPGLSRQPQFAAAGDGGANGTDAGEQDDGAWHTRA